MVAPQRQTRQHAFSTSRNLLNLDCSADLKSYRRDLGPGVQAKCFEKTSDTIREQLDEHRAFLLLHRQNGQASGFPSPVPRLEALPSQSAPNSNVASPHVTATRDNYYTASQPRPLRMLSQPHAPQQPLQASRPRAPVSGQVGTYPTGLRQALERCSQYGHQRQYGVVWRSSRMSWMSTLIAEQRSWGHMRAYKKRTCSPLSFSWTKGITWRTSVPCMKSRATGA